MVYFSLYIMNKSGGLIYQQHFTDFAKLSGNETLRLASTFDSMHAISNSLSPMPGNRGIETLEAETFRLQCFQSMTGNKFFLLADPSTPHMDTVLQNIYELYGEYVLKNPFYEVEMPIHCELFDRSLHKLIAESSKR